MNLETITIPEKNNIFSELKSLLSSCNNMHDRKVCCIGYSIEYQIDHQIDHVFPSAMYFDYNSQSKPLQGVDDQYNLVIYLWSEGDLKKIMNIIKPGGYIIAQENFGLPLELEKSKQFSFIKNLTNDNQRPKKEIMSPFGNGRFDYYVYQKSLILEQKKSTIKNRVLHLLAK